MCFVKLRIGLRNQRSRFPQPEAQLPEQALALAHAQANTVPLLNPGAERLSIPEVSTQAGLARRLAKNAVDFLHLDFAQSSGAARPCSFQQSRQTLRFKTVHPILDGTGRVPQEPSHLWTSHPLGHEKHSMEAVVITRFFRPANLILQAKCNRYRVSDGEWSHASIRPQFTIIRNYL